MLSGIGWFIMFVEFLKMYMDKDCLFIYFEDLNIP